MSFTVDQVLAASAYCDYRTRPPPIPFPGGYPPPFEDCEDNEFLLRCFPGPWLRDCNIAINSPPFIVLGNKSLIDVSTHIIDDLDNTKRFKFQVENVSPNTTREITIPDEDFTLITQTSSDTLTNKTIIGSTNMIGATQFETSGAPVLITSTAPPGAGYTLVTTSTGVATWQLGSSVVGGGNIAYTMTNNQTNVINTSYTTIGQMSWLQSRYSAYSSGIVIFHVEIADRNLDIRLQNVSTATTLGQLTVSSSDTYSFAVTNPTINSILEIQVRKNNVGGISPLLKSVVLEFQE